VPGSVGYGPSLSRRTPTMPSRRLRSSRAASSLLGLAMCINIAVPPQEATAQVPQACHPINAADLADYSLINGIILRQFALFGPDGKANAGLDASSVRELSDFANGIAGEIRALTQSQFVGQLQVLNNIPPAVVTSRSYTVVVRDVAAVGAWACQSGTTTRYQLIISSSFFAKAVEAALKYGIALANSHDIDPGTGMAMSGLNFDEDLKTPMDVLRAARRLVSETNPWIETNQGKDDEQWRKGQPLDVFEQAALREDLVAIQTFATLQYAKLIAFVIGHESSHMWIDNCSSNTSETRADDFGFMLSSLLLDEQMIHAMLYNALTLTRQGFEHKYQAYRAVARHKSAGKFGAGDSVDLKDCYSKWATMSDRELNRRAKALSDVASKYYREALTDFPPQWRGPISKKGFELFTSVYEDIGTAEYRGSDATHPDIEARKARLTDKYANESQIVNKVFGQFVRHDINVSETSATDRSEYIESLIQPVFPPDACKGQPTKKPQSDDPCLSPPPDPEQLQDFE
jgi:hypothetical protein